ncbi:hypothetical protein [Acetobacterium tundrae]|uniref:Uncharacterized protein n=1 Tax=Acetobacterium tundrae TaxID=132932 RepID=A0ABR6WLK2_9FIRM|nr:hypothetical protein [Acetobacterium tundrae]MBC3797364.1 hypothetical protein [Acetobacterium tundrae]
MLFLNFFLVFMIGCVLGVRTAENDPLVAQTAETKEATIRASLLFDVEK